MCVFLTSEWHALVIYTLQRDVYTETDVSSFALCVDILYFNLKEIQESGKNVNHVVTLDSQVWLDVSLTNTHGVKRVCSLDSRWYLMDFGGGDGGNLRFYFTKRSLSFYSLILHDLVATTTIFLCTGQTRTLWTRRSMQSGPFHQLFDYERRTGRKVFLAETFQALKS